MNAKSIFVFDWDGTIFDSMPVKTANFVTAFAAALRQTIPGWPREAIAEMYGELSGRPRREIFDALLRRLGGEDQSASFEVFNAEFERRNLSELANAELFPDAVAYMRRLISDNQRIFVSSSVPNKELETLVEAKLPKDILERIDGIFGSSAGFSKGESHVRRIEAMTSLPRATMIAYGDDIADFDLSSDAGIDCILIDRNGKLPDCSAPRVSSFFQLINWAQP